MKTIFVVYKTDSQHSYASRDIIGLATDSKIAIDICQKQMNKESEGLTKDQRWNLANLKQTQGYAGPGEFQYEEMKTDTLL